MSSHISHNFTVTICPGPFGHSMAKMSWRNDNGDGVSDRLDTPLQKSRRPKRSCWKISTPTIRSTIIENRQFLMLQRAHLYLVICFAKPGLRMEKDKFVASSILRSCVWVLLLLDLFSCMYPYLNLNFLI